MSLRIFVYEYLSGGGEAPAELSAVQAADRPALEPVAALSAEVAERPSLNGATEADAAELLVSGLGHARCDGGRPRGIARGVGVVRLRVARCALWPDGFTSPACLPDGRRDRHRLRSTRSRAARCGLGRGARDRCLALAAGGGGVARQVDRAARPSTLELCSRKRATIAHLAAHGLLTPLAFDAQATCWVVKPDDGGRLPAHPSARHARRSAGRSARAPHPRRKRHARTLGGRRRDERVVDVAAMPKARSSSASTASRSRCCAMARCTMRVC